MATQLEHEFQRRANQRSKKGAPASLWEAIRKLGITITLDQLLPCLDQGTEAERAKWRQLSAFLKGEPQDTIDPPVAISVCRMLKPSKVPAYPKTLNPINPLKYPYLSFI